MIDHELKLTACYLFNIYTHAWSGLYLFYVFQAVESYYTLVQPPNVVRAYI